MGTSQNDASRILTYLSAHPQSSERTASAVCMALELEKAQWERLVTDLLQNDLIAPDGDWAYKLTTHGQSSLPGQETTGQDWSRLRSFLPASLYQSVQAAPLTGRQALCRQHLQQLLTTIATYLPHHLALELLRNPIPPPLQVKGQFLEGTLLFADISGFTALSEMLRVKGGKQGAEELIQIINKYLDVMLSILFKYDGQLIKFGGDAMLGLFTGSIQGALNCVRAAWEMEQAMAVHFNNIVVYQEIVPLNMKVGSNSGWLFAANVGNQEHMEYILTGRAVEQTAHAESSASKGEILISEETLGLVKDFLQVEELAHRPGFYRVTGIQSDEAVPLTTTWSEVEKLISASGDDFWVIVNRLEALSPYLPTGVLTQLVYSPYQKQVEGQHRPATVLFVNFIGMTEIIRALGPENPQAIADELNTYFQAMQDEIQYYGGAVNKVDLYDTGDKLMVIFGAPVARERDTHRATLTALAMQRAMSRLPSPLASYLLSQRIGIHTGFVFAGNVGSTCCNRREYTVMGDTVNLAARLMSKAPPGQIWISQEVFDHIHQNFEIQALPPVELKGITGKVPVYSLESSRLGTETLPTTQSLLSTTLVGRKKELETLSYLLGNVVQGMGIQIVSVIAEGGVGKTRLINEWQQSSESKAGTSITWYSSQGRLYGQKTNGIFVEIIEKIFGLSESDTEDDRWEKLTRGIKGIFPQPDSRLAYLSLFLAMDIEQRPDLASFIEGLNPDNLQLQIRLAICDVLTHVSHSQPLVLILEAMQWVDEASLDLLKFLIDRLSDDLPILFCLTYRPQKERPIWQTWQDLVRLYPDCVQIELHELDQNDGRQLIFDLLNNEQFPEGIQNLIYAATDGNPLYVQEVLNALIKDSVLVQEGKSWKLSRQVEAIQVPENLFQIIQSRIDELDFSSPGARRVLWMASIVGDEFREDLLLHLFTSTGYPKNEFMHHLRELRNAGMLDRVTFPHNEPVGSWYRFRHGLVRQVAYENMLLSNRREYHNLVGQWLEDNHPDDRPRFLDNLAEHYDRAENWEKAIVYHRLAGERDAILYENNLAKMHLERALSLISLASIEPESLGLLHLKLGQVLSITGEYDQALAHLTQAYDFLGQQITDETALSRAQAGYEIARVYERKSGRENLQTALQWQEKALGILPETPSRETARLHALGGLIGLRMLDFERIARECQIALSLSEATHSDLAFIHRVLSIAARAQGNLVEAMHQCERAIAISEPGGDLLGLAIALSNQGVVALEMNDWKQAAASYTRALEIQERIGDVYQMAMTCCNLGDLYYHTGDLDKGFDCTRKGLEGFLKVESSQGEIFARTVLATLHMRKGAPANALEELLQARRLVIENAESEFQATVGRWLAQVYLSLGNLAAADAEIASLLAMTVDELGVEAEPVQCLHGRLLALHGNPDLGRQILQESLERLIASGEKYEAGCTHLALAELLAESGNAETGRNQAEMALSIFNDLGARLDAAQVLKLI